MKPLRAFPLPINVGTDVCQISRIFGIIAEGRATRFINRVLTTQEQERSKHRISLKRLSSYVTGTSKGPVLGAKVAGFSHGELKEREPEVWNMAAFLAGRFAAKEAAMKAHPNRHLTFHDVEVERQEVEGEERLGSGPPVLRIKGEEGSEEDESALISISHDGDYATAVCIGYHSGK